MNIYILTETDSADVTWCYNEAFADWGMAQDRLRDLYKENVIDRPDSVIKTVFNTNDAHAEMCDGSIIAWNIREVELYEK